MKLMVAQIGARRHYAIPRIMYEAGILGHLYTDICATHGWPKLLKYVPKKFRNSGIDRLMGRVPNGIPNNYITSFTKLGWALTSKIKKTKNENDFFEAIVDGSKNFCEKVVDCGIKNYDAVYVFNGAGLEVMRRAKDFGLYVVLDQTMAPMRVEKEIYRLECDKFPDWGCVDDVGGVDNIKRFINREEEEWSYADTILCGSNYVKNKLNECGVSQDKCIVIPYGINKMQNEVKSRLRKPGPIRVLTVGAVGLRKGSPYVVEAAKKMGSRAEFRMVGTLPKSADLCAYISKYVTLVGSVPRSMIHEHFEWADVFVLPSLCEGSALSIYEALSFGLPVICTPNSGSVIGDKIEGFLVPPFDSSGIVEALEILSNDNDLMCEMSLNAVKISDKYNINFYKERLIGQIKAGFDGLVTE